MKKLYLLFYLCLILISCSTTSQLKNDSSNSEIPLKKENKVSKNLYKGKDLVIAVTIPQGRDIDQKELWILLVPGDFDHSVTGEKSQKVTRENDQKSHLTPLIIQFPEDCQKQFLPFL